MSGEELQLAFDASFWLTSFYQSGSLELTNDGELSHRNLTVLHSDNVNNLKWLVSPVVEFDSRFNLDKSQLRKLRGAKAIS